LVSARGFSGDRANISLNSTIWLIDIAYWKCFPVDPLTPLSVILYVLSSNVSVAGRSLYRQVPGPQQGVNCLDRPISRFSSSY
jgi:hypothetical protein